MPSIFEPVVRGQYAVRARLGLVLAVVCRDGQGQSASVVSFSHEHLFARRLISPFSRIVCFSLLDVFLVASLLFSPLCIHRFKLGGSAPGSPFFGKVRRGDDAGGRRCRGQPVLSVRQVFGG